MAREGNPKQLKAARKQAEKALLEIQNLNNFVYINYNKDLNLMAEDAEGIIEGILREINNEL